MNSTGVLIAGMIVGIAPATLLYSILLLFYGQAIIHGFTNGWSGVPIELLIFTSAGGIGLFALWSLWLALINDKPKVQYSFFVAIGLVVGAVLSLYLSLFLGKGFHWVQFIYGAPFVVMMHLVYLARQRGVFSGKSS